MKTTADVVIVGGGCMGASVAFHLAARGVTDVVIIEREKQLGSASTGRNAGGVRHQFSDPANIALSRESIASIANFEAEVGTPVDFWRDGYLFLLSSPAAVASFERNIVLQRAHGIEVEWLSPREAAERCAGLRTDGVAAATFCAADGIADPHGVTQGYAKAAQARGVEIRRDEEVTGISVRNGRVTEVITSRGRISTGTVVNAAGAWAGSIGAIAGVDTPVMPERRHIFIATPAGGGTWEAAAQQQQLPANRLMVIDFDSTFYFHREGGGLLFGMADPDEQPGFDTTVNWSFLPRAIETALTRLPVLADAAVSHAWAGLYEMTPDHNPIIGAAPGVGGFYSIAGFSGHGFQHAPAAGRILADVIVGRDPGLDISSFAHDRFRSAHTRGEANVV